jgi:integrase
MRMSELVERYLRTRRDEMGQATFDGIKGALDRLAKSWDAERRAPSKMDEEWLRDWLYELRQGGNGGDGVPVGPAYYNKVTSRLKGFLEYLIRRGICQPFVLDACKRVPEGDPKEYLRLTMAQVAHMIETTEDPYERWVLALASQTVGRESELLNARIAHLHLDRNELYWYRRKVKQEDNLPITRQLRSEWERWAMVYQSYCGPLDRNKGWYLIPARVSVPLSNARWVFKPDKSPYRISHIVQKHAARVAGVPVESLVGQGVHIMRRSMARALYDRLVADEIPEPTALNRVQVMLGHASPQTTMVYIGVQPDRVKRNELLGGSDLLWVPERENVINLRSVNE